MKIEIEFDGTTQATLIIDGKEMSVDSRAGEVSLEGIEVDEMEGTLGGLIASEIFGTVSDIQQAWAFVDDQGTWDELDESIASEVRSMLFWV